MNATKFYDSKELAEILCVSVKWVEKWRFDIAGATKLGRWRFDRAIIDARLAKGLDVRISKNSAAPRCRKYITSVHGAARSGSKERRDAHGAKKSRP